jgi:hypothetical protein
MARLYKLAYQLRMHRLGDTQLDVLTRNLAFLAAAIILIQWLLRGRPALPAWHWLTLGLILFVAFGIIALNNAAGRAGYVRFAAQPAPPPPPPLAMSPDDKEPVRATGRFEVQEKRGFLADLPGYWRTFGSREHAVMAMQGNSRFLLGSLPPDRLGMWYAFFRPEDVEEVTAGVVVFGGDKRPGLRIAYRFVPPSDGKKPKKPVREVLRLAFDDEAARNRVWADLLADESVQRQTLATEHD